MVRVGVSVEGATEERFVKMLLCPHFSKMEIYLTPISLGGNVSVDRVRSELQKIANGFDHVTTFYDFYGFKNRSSDIQTKEALEELIVNKVHANVRTRLIPYIQMYEFEGLLFSCPDSMANGLNKPEVSAWCAQILREFSNNPEAINCSKETAPSKRLEANTKYKKTTHGPNIACEIGIEKLRSMCCGFHAWMSELENLAD